MRNIVKYDTQGEKRVITCQKRGPEIPIEHGESSPNTCHIEVNDLHIEVEKISSGNVTTTNPNLKRHFPSNDRKKARIQTSTSRTIDDTCGSHDALSLTPTSSNIQKVRSQLRKYCYKKTESEKGFFNKSKFKSDVYL